MISRSSSSDVCAPHFSGESISDEDLIRGFLLALGAGGRKEKTLHIYEDSISTLSDFARSLGLPSLATMDRTHVRAEPSSGQPRQDNEKCRRASIARTTCSGTAAAAAKFQRNFGIFGPPSYCADRLSELIELGVDRFVVRGAPLDPSNPDSRGAERFIQDAVPVLPD